jgi:hypothetical protein
MRLKEVVPWKGWFEVPRSGRDEPGGGKCIDMEHDMEYIRREFAVGHPVTKAGCVGPIQQERRAVKDTEEAVLWRGLLLHTRNLYDTPGRQEVQG